MMIRSSLLVCLVAAISSAPLRAQDLSPDAVGQITAVGHARFADKAQQKAFIDSQIDS